MEAPVEIVENNIDPTYLYPELAGMGIRATRWYYESKEPLDWKKTWSSKEVQGIKIDAIVCLLIVPKDPTDAVRFRGPENLSGGTCSCCESSSELTDGSGVLKYKIFYYADGE